MTVIRLFEAFANFSGGIEPLLFYSNLASKSNVVSGAFCVATLMVTDSVLVSTQPSNI